MHQHGRLSEKGQCKLKAEKDHIQQLHRIIRVYYQRSNSRGVCAVLTDWLIITLCWTICTLTFGSDLFFWVYLCCAVLIASRIRGLENLVHEASHYHLFATRSFNDNLDVIFALPVFRTVKDYRASHMIHHKYLGDASRDPDLQRYIRLGIDDLPNQNWLWALFIRPLIGYHTIEYVQTTFLDFWRSSSLRLLKISFWMVVFVILTLTNQWLSFLLYWLIPLLVILPILRLWAEAAKHCNLDLSHEISSARSNIGFLHRWLIHPHNDGFHTVHHFMPSIPWYRLQKAYQRMLAEPVFNQYCIESHSMYSTFRQMRVSRNT
jgi:fatty acid desaturase